VRTLDAILAPADASTGGAVSSADTRTHVLATATDANHTATETSTTGSAHESGSHSPMMTMRGVDLALTTNAVDALLSRPRAPGETAPINPITGAPDEPAGPDEAAGLRHQIVELDKRMMGPDLEKYATADEIDKMYEDLDSLQRDLEQMTIHPTGGGRYGTTHKTYTAAIEPDGTTHLQDRPNWQWESIFKATFDVTDWAMRSYGDDPYLRAKRRFLDRTRPERFAIGMRYRAEQLARTPQLVQANIDRLWAKVRDPWERKQALFELWDDCAETGEPAVVEAGRVARTFVLGVIHARVTYTPDELARLNARRRSTARFEP
jgi:hypothetical protein